MAAARGAWSLRGEWASFKRFYGWSLYQYPSIVWGAWILGGAWTFLFVAPNIRSTVFGYVPQKPLPKDYPLPEKRNPDIKGYDDPSS